MTTGSWSVGDYSSSFAASKSWTGGDGKTEPWAGGIRAKWNNYAMSHRKMRQIVSAYSAGPSVLTTLADIRSAVGWSNNDDLRLLNKLAEKVRGHSFDLGVNIAEASKSYGTILGNLQSVGSALVHLKHGRYDSALRVLGRGKGGPLNQKRVKALDLKDLSGRWLETQYAFLPMISQSYEAAKALESVTKHRDLKFHVNSSAKRKTINGSASTGIYTANIKYTYSKGISAELYEDISLSRSLGLLNPLEIAWEVVPYSFVVDWFLPIGSYISAWGVIPKLVGRFMTTERGGGKGLQYSKGTNSSFGDLWKLYAAVNRREEIFAIQRTPSSSLSIPRPTFNRLPAALSPRRLLSSVSLIHQRLR